MMEHYLKLKDLPAPQPMEIILDAVADMAAGDWIRAELPIVPWPLYGMLRNMGFQWETRTEGRSVEFLVWRDSMPHPAGGEAGA